VKGGLLRASLGARVSSLKSLFKAGVYLARTGTRVRRSAHTCACCRPGRPGAGGLRASVWWSDTGTGASEAIRVMQRPLDGTGPLAASLAGTGR